LKKTASELSGLVLASKPCGLSSTGLVAMVKKALGGVRTGHSGTLDRFASGLMVLSTGQATGVSDVLLGMDKEYEAVFELGRSTDTHDPEGAVSEERSPEDVATFVSENQVRIQETFLKFQGEMIQIPPQYSALKLAGKRASDYARSGQTVALRGRQVRIQSRIQSLEGNRLRATIKVSSGTYIRALARDLGQALAFPVHLAELCRTSVGTFSLDGAWKPGEAGPYVLSLLQAFPEWPRLPVSDENARRIRQGGFVPVPALSPGRNFFFLHHSGLLAWGVSTGDSYRYRRVFQ